MTGTHSYIISNEESEPGYTASVKPIGSTPFDGRILVLGGGYGYYRSLTLAKLGCEAHAREQVS